MRGRRAWLIAAVAALLVGATMERLDGVARGQGHADSVKVACVKMPYVGERNVAELSPNPDYLEAGGLVAVLSAAGADMKPIATVRLSPDQEREYGAWNRLALANGHLADTVAADLRQGFLSVGLLANCSSLMGMLGGVQHSAPDGGRLRVGLVYLDAHADFNTPETTLSGMLGGMDVAVSAGMCLTNLRIKSKLDPALSTRNIILGGVRDTDPLEQELIDRSDIVSLPSADLRVRSDRFRQTLARLAQSVDRIYVHVDMDVLDPREVPGHSLSVPGGPTSAELASAITEMFREEKTVAIGIASTPAGERDKDRRSRDAAYALIKAAIEGVRQRQGRQKS